MDTIRNPSSSPSVNLKIERQPRENTTTLSRTEAYLYNKIKENKNETDVNMESFNALSKEIKQLKSEIKKITRNEGAVSSHDFNNCQHQVNQMEQRTEKQIIPIINNIDIKAKENRELIDKLFNEIEKLAKPTNQIHSPSFGPVENRSINNSLEHLREQNTSLKRSALEKDEKLKNEALKAKEMQKIISNLKDEIEILKRTTYQYPTSVQNETTSDSKRELEEENENLKKVLSEKTNEIGKKSASLKKLRERVKSLTQPNEELERNIIDLTKELEKRKLKEQTLIETLDEMRKNNFLLKKENDNMKQLNLVLNDVPLASSDNSRSHRRLETQDQQLETQDQQLETQDQQPHLYENRFKSLPIQFNENSKTNGFPDWWERHM